MQLETILSNYLNGEPLHDAIAMGIVMAVVFEFYKVVFSSIFTIFKK